MSDDAGHTLQYNIYRADGTTIWDETNPMQSTANGGIGSGSTTPGQVQSYIAKINPSQTTPPAGSYTDTVNVIISFPDYAPNSANLRSRYGIGGVRTAT